MGVHSAEGTVVLMADFVLGLDLDGVCGDYTSEFRRHVSRATGTPEVDLPDPTHWSFAESGWGITEEQFADLHRVAVRNGMFRAMPVFDGAAEALWELSDADVHIRVITHRLVTKQLHQVSVTDTVTWLDSHNIPYRDVCFVANKSKVDADVYLDDAPHNITSLRAAGRDVIVFSAPYNQHISGPRANTWVEVRDMVLERLEKFNAAK